MSALVRLAARALPAGDVRERYRREFLAELHSCRRGARLRYSIGVLTHVLGLRMAVGDQSVPVAERDFALVRKPLLCRLRMHFRVRCVNEDRASYYRCHRCGDDQYDFDRNRDPSNVAGAVAANIIGGGGMGGGGVGA